MRYVIIGAGAVGGSVGGLLERAGESVVLIARGEHGDRIRQGGLKFVRRVLIITCRVPAMPR